MKRVLIVLPFLLGNIPAPCPEPGPGDQVVAATVTSVERAQYRCVVVSDPAPVGQRCITAWSSCDLVLHVADGTTRTATTTRGNGMSWCDLPAGHHTLQLCTESGTVDCALDLGTDSLWAYVESSLPARERIHLRLADGAEVVRDTDLDFKGGEHIRYIVRAPNQGAAPLLDSCDIGEQAFTTRRSTSMQHGCGHCSTGSADAGYLVFAAVVLLVMRRRRR